MSSSPRSSSLCAAVVLASAAGVACEDPPCESDVDCFAGQVCEDGSCVAGDGGGGGGGGGGEGEGEGEGEGDLLVVQSDFPIRMFLPGAVMGQGDGVAVVGEFGGGIDQVRFFDLAAGTFLPNPLPVSLDFTNNSVGGQDGCDIDNVSVERGVDPTNLADEFWFSCTASGLEQTLTSDVDQLIRTVAGRGADLIVPFGRDNGNREVIVGRRAYARRGEPNLYVEQIVVDQLDRPAARPEDVVNVQFGAIAGLFRVTDSLLADGGSHGDLLLVFDRAYPALGGAPALVPIERVNDLTTWEPATPPWAPVLLPLETHAVRLGTIDDPDALVVDATQADLQNVALFLPTLGNVVFARLETELSIDQAIGIDDTGFNSLLFIDELPAAVPPPSERILIVDSPQANAVFYVLRGANRAYGWQLPLHSERNDDNSNDVKFAQFSNEAADRPNGIVAISGQNDAAWITVAQTPELHRIPFALNN